MTKIPSVPRQPLDTRASLLMLVFCVTLGLQQVAMKAVASAINPVAQAGFRSLFALVLVLAVMRWQKIPLIVRGQIVPGLLVGLGYAAEFAFVAMGLNYTYAAHMSVFLYTAPVFAAIGLHLLVPGEQLKTRHWIGVGIAFVGMLVALAPAADLSPRILLGDILGVLGALSWAATTLVLRLTTLAEAPSLRPTAFQLIITAVGLLAMSAGFGDLRTIHMTPLAWSSMVFQTLGIAFGMLLLWFWLLRRYLAWQLGVFSFLTPLFGVAFGVILLHEPITINFVAGSVAILAGLLLVSVHKRRPKAPHPGKLPNL
ncbi:MAG TPA: DMT family transporter [Castellaniella sp.]|uniref:DMT family transporter n=1 Tax=Castellaniella sp. TaxID=1955812 RepID=UPI002EF6B34B